MSLAPRIDVKGWCPGALRPMESGDGLVVRIRPRAGTLSLAQWTVLAEVAATFGNRHLDLTRRANVQVRGAGGATLAPLLARLQDAGLLDEDVAAEAVRNIMLSPLAGLDAAETADLRPVAIGLAAALMRAADLHRLPSKFGFSLDGGGVASLQEDRADIRLVALDADTVAIGFDRSDDTMWLGRAPMASAVDVGMRLARMCLDHVFSENASGGLRFRQMTDQQCRSLVAEARALFSPLPAGFARWREKPRRPIGLIKGVDATWIVGVGVAFGQITAVELSSLIDAASAAGAVEMRPSPWRILYIPCGSRAAAEGVLTTAARLGFLTRADAPLLRFEACPGAPWCRSADGETRAVARRLAAAAPAGFDDVTVHVSGCRKGCAAPSRAHLTLVASGDGFDVITDGRASAAPVAHIDGAALAGDPAQLFSLVEGGGRA